RGGNRGAPALEADTARGGDRAGFGGDRRRIDPDEPGLEVDTAGEVDAVDHQRQFGRVARRQNRIAGLDVEGEAAVLRRPVLPDRAGEDRPAEAEIERRRVD